MGLPRPENARGAAGRYFIRLTPKDQFGNVISTADDIEVIVH